MGKASRGGIPSLSKVLNGTYIDFESFGQNERGFAPPPVLLGIYRTTADGDFGAGFRQIVFTEQYRFAAEDSSVSHEVVYEPDRTAFLNALTKAARKSAPVFAFSEHELDVLAKVCGYSLDRRYANVLKIAKAHLQRSASATCSDWRLQTICEQMNIPLPYKMEKGGVTEKLRIVREYSSSKAKWQRAPEAARQAWREVLLHNYNDVMAIYEIMRQLSSGNPPSEEGAG